MNALICLHPGVEEIEAVVPIDLLSRAEVSITQAACGDSLLVKGRSGIVLQADCLLSECADQRYDLVVLPGGPGINELREDPTLCALLRKQMAAKRHVACICAAPLLLKDAGLHEGRAITCHPTVAAELDVETSAAVVVDETLITSRGAGTATEFALTILETLKGPETARAIAHSICWSHSNV